MRQTTRIVIPLLFLVLASSCGGRDDIIGKIHQHEYQRFYQKQFFSEVLNSSDIKVRGRAAVALGRIGAEESRLLLINQLSNEKSEEVLVQLLWALTQMKNHHSEIEKSILLFAQTENRDMVRAAVSSALGVVGSKLSEPYLTYELNTIPEKRQLNAALAVALLAKNKKLLFREALLPLEKILSAGSSVSWSAAYAYFQMATPHKIEVLSNFLPESDERTQVYLIRAIYEMIQNLADPELQKMLPPKAYKLLVDQANSKRLWENISHLETSPSWRVRREVVKFYTKINPETHEKKFTNFIQDKSIHVQLAAWSAFQYLGSKQSLKRIETGLKSKNDNIFEVNLISYVTRLKSKAVGEVKKWLGKDVSPVRQVAAIRALSTLITPESIGLVNNMTNSKNNKVKLEALSALANMHPEYKQIFIRSLRENDPGIVSVSATALSGNCSPGDIQYLVKAYRKFNTPGTAETAMDILKVIVNNFPRLPADTLKKMASPAISHTYKFIADYLSSRGDSLPPLKTVNDLKIYDTAKMPDKIKIKLTTVRGDMIIELFPRIAPQTVQNFIVLVKKGFYNGLTFHRVVSDFVVQGGDPDGTGWGGPGYAIPSERSNLMFERGTVGMATAGKDTAGSQFFICHSTQPHLNGRYTIFGKLVDGFDVLDKIERDDVIQKITIQ